MTDEPLAVEHWGEGPPVLLLHGIGGSSRYWHSLRAVSSGYRATAPDLLGFGRSPKPEGGDYDVDAHLDALLPLVQPGSVVVAHSTGSVLAAALAARRPDLVRALLLVSAPVYADVPAARRAVRRLGLLARVTVTGEIAGRVTMVLLHAVGQPLSRWLPLGLPREVVDDFWRHTWTSYSRTLRAVVVGHPAAPDLRDLRLPCRLLHGQQDETALREPLPALLGGPWLTAREVPGGHHLPVQQPGTVAAALEDLLADLAAE